MQPNLETVDVLVELEGDFDDLAYCYRLVVGAQGRFEAPVEDCFDGLFVERRRSEGCALSFAGWFTLKLESDIFVSRDPHGQTVEC
jgi:hypothetical protein